MRNYLYNIDLLHDANSSILLVIVPSTYLYIMCVNGGSFFSPMTDCHDRSSVRYRGRHAGDFDVRRTHDCSVFGVFAQNTARGC